MKKPSIRDYEFPSDYEAAMEEYEQWLIDYREEQKLERRSNERD